VFTFKKFTVCQAGAAMKVGTDGVLLGAWCPMAHRPVRVLDIGTGTGLIALMAAQRGEAWGCEADAVEIDAEAAQQARANFAASPWADRLRIYNADIKGFITRNGLNIGHHPSPKTYDLIVSNPPFFSETLVSPDARRALARHTEALTYDELTGCAAAALGDEGVFAVIVPFDHASAFIAAAAHHGLHPHSRLDVRPTPAHAPHRSLLAFGRTAAEPACDTLVIETARHIYTPEYRALTRDFYLKF
jgi:tRNA1Val (adenine37-N6)-methyltransferase